MTLLETAALLRDAASVATKKDIRVTGAELPWSVAGP